MVSPNWVLIVSQYDLIEKEMNSTVFALFGFELTHDKRSTWPMGEGTVAFYDIITTSQVTGNDAFRSNQIREVC